MSTTVDQRVVEMRFDNQHFERNVQTSMSTLDKLKQKLNFKGASKGLEDVSAAAKNCNLSPLGAAVEGVKVKFSAMEVMAVTALSNITNSAVNAGKRMIKALTIEPVMTGFKEYETQINAVQTILANTKSKGSTLDDVNSALDELNTYADKTIYNFTEMTRNIGTFTAAGVDLNTSVNAIQGIANLAAVSGSTSQQASTAMYQLSQALAAGTVKLMDWNSVVNAGMGGEIFQDALKKTSEELQTGAAAAIEAEGSFRESLKTGWLTSEVLTETLKKFTTSGANEYVAEYTGLSKEAVEAALEDAKAKYGEAEAIEYASKALAEKSGKNADEIKSVLDMAATAQDAATKVKTFSQLWDTLKESAQSGWTQTWEIIIGDFEEAKELLTGLSDFFGAIIQKVSDARNKVLEGALGKTFTDLKEKINSALAPAKKAVDTVNKVKESVSDLGNIVNDVILGKFGNGQERIDKLTKSGQNYYRIQNKVNETLGNAFRYTDEQIEAQDKLLGIQKETTEGTKEETAETVKLTDEKKNLIKKIASMNEAQASAEGYTREQIAAFQELGKTADKLGMPLDEFIDKMDEIDGRWLLIDSFKSIGKSLVEVFKAIGKAWKNVFPSSIDDKADTLFNIIAAFHKFSRGVLTAATENADKLRRTFEGLFAILDIIRTVAGGVLGLAFRLLNAVLSSMNLNVLDVTASIGDVIVAFRNWLKENNFIVTALEKLGSFIGKAIVFIRDFVKMVLGIPAVQNAITKFKNACSNIFSKVGDYFSEGGKRIKEFIDRVKAMDSLSLADLGKIFKDFKDNVLGYFFNFDAIFEGAKKALSKFRDAASSIIGEVGDKFEWVKDKISGLITFIKDHMPQIIAVVMGFGLVKALKKIGDALEVIAEPIKGFTDLLQSASGVLNSFSGYIKAKAWNEKASAVLKLAIALGILTACIVALTLVDPDRLWSAVGALGALMGILAVFTLLVTLISKLAVTDPSGFGKGLGTVALSMLAMAAALSLLVKSLKAMDSLDPEKVWDNLKVLGVMAAGLTALTIALTRLGGRGSLGASIAMLAMAASLKMMIGVLVALGKADIKNADQVLGLLAIMIAGFAILLRACKGVKLGGALALIGIVLALKLAIGAMQTLGKMDVAEINKGLRAIIPILALFALVMVASNLAGKNAAKAGVGILAMSVAMVVLAHAIKQLGSMSQSTLDNGLHVVSTLMLIFGAIVALSYFAGKNAVKAGAMLVAMSVAMLVLVGVIWALQGISDEGLDRALGAIVTIGLVFAALIAVSKLAASSKGMIITLTIAIVALAAVVIGLSLLDPESLKRATIALDSIIGLFAILVFALGTIKKANAGSAIGAVLVLTSVVIALAAVLVGLTCLPNAQALLPAAGALSLLLLSLSVALIVLSKCGDIAGKTIGATYALAGVVLILGGILTLMSLWANPQTIIPITIALSAMLLAFSGAMVILSKCDELAEGSIKAMYALVGIVALLGVILSAMSFLPNPENLLPVVVALSIMLLAFSGALFIISKCGTVAEGTIGVMYALSGVVAILGVILSAMSFLPNPEPLIPIATALSIMLIAFSAALFILSKCGTVAASTIGAAYALTGVVLILGGILSAMSFLPNPENLLPIAISLSAMLLAFSVALGILCLINVNVGGATNAALGLAIFVGIFAALVAALGGLAQIPGFTWLIGEGGKLLSQIGFILGEFVGSIIGGIGSGITSGLPKMAEDLTAFSEGIKPFIENMSGIDASVTDGIKNLAAAILVLTGAELLDGLASLFGGDKSMKEFGNEIGDLGGGLKKFADEVDGIDGETVKAGAEALKNIALAAKAIPNDGGVAGLFAGENNIGDFVAKLPDVGANLTKFSTSLTGFNALAAEAGAKALKTIAVAASEIPNDGGVAGFFAGENNIGDFVAKLPDVGTNLTKFSTSLTGFNALAAEAGAKALKNIALAAHDIPNDGGVAGFFAGENNIGDFVAKLPDVGANLTKFSTSLTGFNALVAESATKSLKNVIDAADAIPNEGGLAKLFAGDNSLDTFTAKLPSVGAGLVSFSDSLAGYQHTLAENGMSAISDICTKFGNMTVGSGLSSLFNADSGIQNYVTYLPGIGEDLSAFTKALSGTNSYVIESGVKAIGSIATMTDSLPDNFDSLSTFGSKLTDFGENLQTYFTTMSGVTEEAISNTTAAADSLNKLSSSISVEKATSAANAIEELVKMLNSTSSISADSTSGFTASLDNLAAVSVDKIISEFDSASSKVTEAGKSIVTKFINGAKSAINNVSMVGQSISTKFIDGIKAKKEDSSKIGKTLVEQVANSIKKQTSTIKNAAISMMKGYISGLKIKESDAKKAAKNIASACVTSAKNEAKNATSAGKNFVTGFANGISANTFRAKAQAVAMAEAALEAAEDALDIQSPSKETYRIGGFFGQGFTNAVEEYGSKSYDVAYGMADYAKKGLSGAISKINDVMNSDFDTQPTIRPVVDLTNVKSGVNAISSMLNRRPSVGVMSEVGSITSMMSWQSQNGASNDVVSAIKDLSDKLSGSSGDNYNINGITYDDGTNISNAVQTLVRAARVGRRR